MKITERKNIMKKGHQPATCYGNHHCVFCRLTVAEYINGKSYPLPDGTFAYAHDGCQMDHLFSTSQQVPDSK